MLLLLLLQNLTDADPKRGDSKSDNLPTKPQAKVRLIYLLIYLLTFFADRLFTF